MKRILTFVLACLLSLSLWACGDEPAVDQGNEATQPKPTLPVSTDTLSGTYKPRLWFMDHTLTFSKDGTYAFSDGEKGAYSLTGQSISMLPENGTQILNLMVDGRAVYTYDTWHFDADVTSGVTFSPDRNGHSDQSFEGRTPGGNIPGTDYSWILLDLDADGTFALQLGNQTDAEPEVRETFEGTYSTDKYILTLTYQGTDYPLVMSNANYIYFYIYDRVPQ